MTKIMRVATLALATGLVFAAASRADSQQTGRDANHGAAVRSLAFVDNPKWRRIQNPFYAGAESIMLEASILVRGTDGEIMGGVPVRLSARSHAGLFASGVDVTNSNGRARPQLQFHGRPGSLDLSTQACLGNDASVCTEVMEVSLRDWTDGDLGLDATFFASRQGESNDLAAGLVFAQRVQINVWETEHRWRHYRFSVYGSVPVIFQSRALLLETASSFVDVMENRGGVGDFAAGVNLDLRSNMILDVAYNGRNGKVNLIDAVRTLGRPGVVNLGDGFESIDASLMLNTFLGDRAFLFAVGSLSRPLQNRQWQQQTTSVQTLRGISTTTTTDASLTAARSEFWQAVAGVGWAYGGDRAARLWAGYQRTPAIQISEQQTSIQRRQGAADSVTVRPERLTVNIPTQDQWLLGVNMYGLSRRRVQAGTGMLLTWIDKDQLSFSVSLNLNFHLY